MTVELDVARPQRERLGAAQAGPVEGADQRAVADAGRVAARRLRQQRGGFIAAKSLRQFSGDASTLLRWKCGYIENIGRSEDRLKA